ncbi:GNAT family N-acetyltransferase [Embleya sp. NPDC059267]|uniref:GNAT family N-acetyltransferase n=1 Tax=Embleya sp. NPDC059267 TaxID=3346798 RepID=UPI0036BFD2DF
MTTSDTNVTASPHPEPRTELVVTDAPTPADITVISDALDRFNIEHTGIADRKALAVLVRDPETHRVVGGLTGRRAGGVFVVDLWPRPRGLRGRGVGRARRRRAAPAPHARGCRTAVLYTITFQAPGFYRKQGWKLLGEVPCDPPGAGRVFMTKELTAPTGRPVRPR